MRSWTLAPIVALAACASAPAPPPAAEVGLEPPPPSPSLARWFRKARRPLVGPLDANGDSIALLGGRRAVIRKDGSVSLERPETARPIDDAVLVPTSGGPLLVAMSDADLTVFADPLGAAKVLHSFSEPARLAGCIPGAVLVHAGAESQLFDVTTGSPAPVERFFPLDPIEVMFIDDRRGVASFELGSFWTDDGGRTWNDDTKSRPSADIAAFTKGFVVFQADGELWSPFTAAPTGSPTRDWLTVRGDPIAAAIERGISGGDGTAYVADRGTLGHVDLGTGRVLGALELTKKPVRGCELTRGAGGALLATCASYYAAGDGVHARIDTSKRSMRLVDAQPIRNEGSVTTSRDGGVLFTRGCSPSDHGGVCVLQPDGTFASLGSVWLAEVLPRADGSALYAHIIEGSLAVGSLSKAGTVELARTAVHHERPRIEIIDRPKPLVAVTSKTGTEVFELDGNQLRLARRLDCTQAHTRGGAFACSGASIGFLRGPDDADFRELGPEVRRGVVVSPVGFATASALHVGLRELAEPLPERPAAVTKARSPALGRLTCVTQGQGKQLTPLPRPSRLEGPAFTLPDGWRGIANGADIALLKVVGRGDAAQWHLRWQSVPMLPDALEARLPAPTTEPPNLAAISIHRGVLALEITAGRERYAVGARSGVATTTKVDSPLGRIVAGHDGTIAWQDQSHVHIAPPGKGSGFSFGGWLSSSSTPSSEGIFIVLKSGSFEARHAGPAELSPSLFDRRLSAAKLSGSLPELAPCPKGVRGRTIELREPYPLELRVDERVRQHGSRYGRVHVLLDHPSPCVAVIDSGGTVVDFLDGVARERAGDRITDLRCTWSPPAPGE